MTMGFDSNLVLSKKEREERVLDLHFNQNKNYRQIAQENKSLSVQAYDKFSKGKTLIASSY
jgi:hypothetical protein